MYETVKEFNEDTVLALYDGEICVLKAIAPSEIALYRRIKTIACPNLVQVYEITASGEKIYARLEYARGINLYDYVKKNGVLSEEQTVDFALQLCNGLRALHSHGIVHRDITPNNIIIDENKRLKIIDYGISRIQKLNASSDTQLLGTYNYASPESYGFDQTDCRSDIYSLGVVMNFMLTGEVPKNKLAYGRLSTIIVKCIQIDANNRYANTDEIVADLTQKNMALRRSLRNIPGFRKGKLLNELIACLYYFAAAFVTVCVCWDMKSLREIICILGCSMFTFFVPVGIIFDYGNWLEKASFTKNQSKGGKIGYKILFTGLSLFISVVFILAAPN